MSSAPRKSRRARAAAVSFLAAGAVVGGLLAGTTPASAAPDGETRPAASKQSGRYIVVLRAPSATQYDGGRAFARTSPKGDQQFDADSDAVRDYTRHLERTHRTIAAQIGTSVAHDYTMALNGFAARLTSAQAAALAKDPRVLTVAVDEARSIDTWKSPEFLGLTGKNGAWRQHGGRKNAGAGTVVGILDTGIWPESRSFAGKKLTENPKGKWDVHRIGGRVYMDKADGQRFSGACETGEGWNRNDCNTKLIGARYYADVFETLPADERHPEEWLSTRDGDGHGTHTAGTAAGQARVPAEVEDREFGLISGMAPAARVAAYKVCFSDTDPNSGDCYTSSSVAAIDDAVADGVDVINYSISGARDTVDDPVELAFEGAAEAGIFVATSAGNSGPDAETVAHPSPWLTTVAASTHVTFENTVVLGNGQKFVGASITQTRLPQTPLVESIDAPAAGASADDADLCYPGSLDPAKVSGTIVVCTRGAIARVDKSAAVEQAGGVGMILANPGPGQSLDADFHSVPTVHVDDVAANAIWDYLDAKGGDATAAIRLGNRTDEVTPVPQIAGFSSRGPSLAFDADILKPDIAAPGVSVLAAVAPPTNSGRDFDLYSGTSMASPHIAGLAAFVAGQNPGWTPMQIKSAMMTTARSLFGADGKLAHDPFAQGAGQVRPKKFFDPGLFVTSGAEEWRGFLEGQGVPTGHEPVAAKDVNQPSMAMGQVVGSVEFPRTFTADRAGTWTIDIDVPGFIGEASQGQIVSTGRGDTQQVTFTFTREDAEFNEFTSGFVTLDGPTKVRIPVALRPVSVKAPDEVAGEGASGSTEVEILPGFTGSLDLSAYGLEEAETHADSVNTSSNGFYDDYCVTVSEDTRVLRANLDAAPASGDTLDLYLHSLQGDCSSDVDTWYYDMAATPSGDEQFTWENPTPGSYLVSVELYEPPAGQTSVDYVLDIFNVDDTSTAGGFTVTPDPVPVVSGEETSYTAEWTGLDADKRYLGIVEYQDGLRWTYLTVDTSAAPQP